jgi:phage terminase large subunit
LLRYKGPEVLLSGPAGTGKSVGCLWKLHYCASEVPGFRGLILRKTRASLTDSGLVTFERDVLTPGHAATRGAARANRHSYHYPNGSEIVTGGLDPSRVTSVMSTDYDMIYVQEATELNLPEWEALTTRLRNGRLPFQQLVADANPDSPRHWLKRRCDRGATKILESRHEDNPRLWDAGLRRWTPFAHNPDGSGYIDKLDNLTGHRKMRLRHGRWVQAEGVVYEGWDPKLHLIDRFAVPAHWPRLWSIDFGFTNPFVWQEWALGDDSRLYRVREIYMTQRLVEDHARRILELTRGQPPPAGVVCDHDAEDRATFERHAGLPTAAAAKAKAPGFQAVAERLRRAKDGHPRLFLLRDALDERDAALDEQSRPCCTEEEFDGYVWDQRQGVTRDEPVKANDHGMDAMRYLVYTLDQDAGRGHDTETRFERVS